jgi:hypothetical protein
MMMMAISRAVGIHRLTLLNFYPYLQRYIQPHQRDVTQLLAAAVQACHDLVHPFVMPPLFCVEYLACMACPEMNLYRVCGNKPQRNCLHGL